MSSAHVIASLLSVSPGASASSSTQLPQSDNNIRRSHIFAIGLMILRCDALDFISAASLTLRNYSKWLPQMAELSHPLPYAVTVLFATFKSPRNYKPHKQLLQTLKPLNELCSILTCRRPEAHSHMNNRRPKVLISHGGFPYPVAAHGMNECVVNQRSSIQALPKLQALQIVQLESMKRGHCLHSTPVVVRAGSAVRLLNAKGRNCSSWRCRF